MLFGLKAHKVFTFIKLLCYSLVHVKKKTTTVITSKAKNQVCSQLADLSELVGEFIQHWGFKSIHGQIWLQIFVSTEPIDATTLVKRLNVSKALVSLAIKDLLHYQVIILSGKGQKRTVFYKSNPDLFKVIKDVLENREKKLLERIESASLALQALPLEKKSEGFMSAERIDELNDMVSTAQIALKLLLEKQIN